ncbi:response regulator [Cohnella suwonensis]|uniref:Response regulator n=1 Tax=Cohnella suwonensis TaxID=696072 RepID=A0ABW0LVE1_9BACL
MMRVLIVDDEPIYRLALRELIRWEDYGCEIVGEASNGQDALRLITPMRIDLVLVDIQMPILSGLAFLQKLRESEEGSQTGVIVLSAYSQYEYVRQAFVYGVYDYIIKEDLNAAHVGEVILKAVQRLREVIDEQEQKERDSLSRTEKIREQAFRSLVHFQETADAEGSEASNWLLSTLGSRHVVCCLIIDRSSAPTDHESEKQRSRFIVHTIRQVADGYKINAIVTCIAREEYAVLFLLPGLMGELQAREVISEMLNKTISHLRVYMNLWATWGVSRICTQFAYWGESFRQSKLWAETRFYLGSGRAYFEEDVTSYTGRIKEPVWNVPELLHDLESGNAGWRNKLDKGLDDLAEAYGVPVEKTLHAYRALLWEISSLLYSKGLAWENITGEPESPLERLGQFEQANPLNVWFRSLIQTVFDSIDPKKRIMENSPPLVDKVKKWIDRHFHEPISLTNASESVGISESYLSRLFAKETGETFIEYVTRKRVETAIQMMGSGMKIYEIAEKVGYPNQGHFSKIFKKVTGKTPLEYREEMLSK